MCSCVRIGACTCTLQCVQLYDRACSGVRIGTYARERNAPAPSITMIGICFIAHAGPVSDAGHLDASYEGK